jgi:hypothetical protein
MDSFVGKVFMFKQARDGSLQDRADEMELFYLPSESVKKLVFIVHGPFRMALFPELWNAGRHRLDNLPWQ